jgi:hypothetical protein
MIGWVLEFFLKLFVYPKITVLRMSQNIENMQEIFFFRFSCTSPAFLRTDPIVLGPVQPKQVHVAIQMMPDIAQGQ